MLEFKNKAVAAKYESEFTNDPMVHVPGGTAGNGWKGNLSTITLDAADKLHGQGSNLITIKNEEPVNS